MIDIISGTILLLIVFIPSIIIISEIITDIINAFKKHYASQNN